MKLKGLGRGLDALLSDSQATSGQEELRSLPPGDLEPGKYQPRTRMDQDSLEELAASIRAQGIMQPILVRPLENRRYEIIAGERRWRAAQMAGLSEVPVLVRSIPDEAALAMALIENIQRENLNPLEEALGLERLIKEFSLTHQQAADAVGRSRPATSNLLRLLQLAPPIQDLLLEGDIEMGHARALLPLEESQQVEVARKVVKRRLSVRETERQVQNLLSPGGRPVTETPDEWGPWQEQLRQRLGVPVAFRPGSQGGGKIELSFSSPEELQGLLRRLSPFIG